MSGLDQRIKMPPINFPAGGIQSDRELQVEDTSPDEFERDSHANINLGQNMHNAPYITNTGYSKYHHGSGDRNQFL